MGNLSTAVATIETKIGEMEYSALEFYAFMEKECMDVSLTFLPPVLTIALMFIGVKIALRQSFADQFVNFTITTIIAFLILQLQWPQKMMIVFQQDLIDGFKEWSTEIYTQANGAIGESSGDIANGDPVTSWYAWIDSGNKFSPVYSMYNISGVDISGLIGRSTPATAGSIPNLAGTPGSTIKEWINELNALGPFVAAVQAVLATISKVGVVFSAPWNPPMLNITGLDGVLELLLGAFFCLLFGPMALGQILTIATAKATALVLPMMNQMALLVAAKYAFYISLCLGIIFVPLMFLGLFKEIGVKYCMWNIGLMLVPALYYLLSALGFFVATFVFKEMIVSAQIGKFYASILISTVMEVATEIMGGMSFHMVYVILMIAVVTLFVAIGLFMAGTTLVAATVAGGVSFSALATQYAKAWQAGFVTEGVEQHTSRIFNAFHSALSSASGQGMSQGMSMLGSGSAGIIGKAGG